MATKQEQALIRDLYGRLNQVTENKVHEAYEIELRSERKHRDAAPDGWTPSSFTAEDSAKYFTLLFTFKGLVSHYTVNDIFDVRLVVLYGQAVANKYKDAIKQEFKPEEVAKLLELNYAKMME